MISGLPGIPSAVPLFALELVPDRDRVLLRPVGEVDLLTAGQVEQSVIELFDRGFTHVVVDLRRVTFLDSSGVHAILRAHRRSRELKRYMAVMPGNDVSRRVLELTGALDLLEVEPTKAAVV